MICGKSLNVGHKLFLWADLTGLARVINGIGTGMLNVIVPVWVRSLETNCQASY